MAGLLVYVLVYTTDLEKRITKLQQENNDFNKNVTTTLFHNANEMDSIAESLKLHVENDLTREQSREYNKNHAPRSLIVSKRKVKAGIGGP